MPHAPAIRDPKHPDFPHGTDKGHRRGCDCTPCEDAAYREGKMRRTRISRGVRLRLSDEEMAQLRGHVNHLRSLHPGFTVERINAAAGLNKNALRRVMRDTTARFERSTAARVLAVTPDKIAPAYYPIEETRRIVGGMQALGYSLRYIERESGVKGIGNTMANRAQRTTRAKLHEPVAALAARIAGREATPENCGMSRSSITQAKAAANAAGYYPAACYDDEGNLDPRAIPGHPWAIADEHAHDMIDALRIVIARNDDERRERMARSVGLAGAHELPRRAKKKSDRDPEHAELHTRIDAAERRAERIEERFEARVKDPNRQANIAMLRRLYLEFENGTEDALSFGLRTGIVKLQNSLVPRNHPSVQAHIAWLAEEQEAAA